MNQDNIRSTIDNIVTTVQVFQIFQVHKTVWLFSKIHTDFLRLSKNL